MAPATTAAAAAQQPQIQHPRLGSVELPSDSTDEEAAWATVRASCVVTAGQEAIHRTD